MIKLVILVMKGIGLIMDLVKNVTIIFVLLVILLLFIVYYSVILIALLVILTNNAYPVRMEII